VYGAVRPKATAPFETQPLFLTEDRHMVAQRGAANDLSTSCEAAVRGLIEARCRTQLARSRLPGPYPTGLELGPVRGSKPRQGRLAVASGASPWEAP